MLDQLLAMPAGVHITLAAVVGLLVGSFLNVVIFRLPKILHYQWTAQSYEWLNKEPYDDGSSPSLSKPPSHCSQCKAPVKPWQNVPVISYLLLKGRCANCKQSIGVRYPLVEILTSVLSAYVMAHFGWSTQAFFGILLTWVLIALTFIDFDHQLLPDDIVYPTLWLGLGLSLWGVFSNTPDAVVGCIVGYLCFWIVFQLYKALTGKEGMGHGDFKLMALLGAWFGWQYLPQIILLSTVIGSVFGIGIMIAKKANSELAIPFGPYIATAGWIAMIWGPELNRVYLSSAGF